MKNLLSAAAHPFRRVTALSACVVLLGLATPPAPARAAPAATGAPPPAAAFGTVPRTRGATLSPNGRYIAWADVSGAAERVLVFDVQTGKFPLAVPLPESTKFLDVFWADDATLLVELGATRTVDVRSKYEFERILAVPLSGAAPKLLLMSGGNREWVTGATVVALRTSKPGTIVMSTVDFSPSAYREQTGSRIAVGRKDSGWIGQLYSVDTATGQGTVIASGTPFTSEWAVDTNGEPVARSEWDQERGLFTLHARQGTVWREIFRLENGSAPTLFGLTADGTAVYVLGTLDGDRKKLWAIPLDASAPRVVVGEDERDVEAVGRDPFTRQPTVAYLGGIDGQRRWVDPQAEAKWQSVARAFPPDRVVDVYGRSQDGRRILAHVQGPSAAPVYYFVDFDAKRADIIGEEYPGLVNAALGTKSSVTYAARDGTSIAAYLTAPPGAATGPRPLVVLPHGGPAARDDPDFDWLAQFLATRGYVVLQPQFRGSTGFGRAFRLAGYGEWGGRMQDDVTDGVKAMIDRGVVDPKRICIVGASYGGYAALAGATLTPDLYACVVSVAGVSDLPAMLGYEQSHSGRDSDALAYWREHIGSVHDPKIAQRSPARLAAAVRAPVLLIHGEDDTVVPIAQSRTMAQALTAAGKPVTFVTLPGEDHHLARSATRIRTLEEIERFTEKYLR